MPVDNTWIWEKAPECGCKTPEDCTGNCSVLGKSKNVVIKQGSHFQARGGTPDLEHETLLETLDDYYETIKHDPKKLKEFMVKFVAMNEERYNKNIEVFKLYGFGKTVPDIESFCAHSRFAYIPFNTEHKWFNQFSNNLCGELYYACNSEKDVEEEL